MTNTSAMRRLPYNLFAFAFHTIAFSVVAVIKDDIFERASSASAAGSFSPVSLSASSAYKFDQNIFAYLHIFVIISAAIGISSALFDILSSFEEDTNQKHNTAFGLATLASTFSFVSLGLAVKMNKMATERGAQDTLPRVVVVFAILGASASILLGGFHARERLSNPSNTM